MLKPRSAYRVSGHVDFIEKLGSDTILHVDIAGTIFTVKTSGSHRFETGQEAGLYMDLDSIHLFGGDGEAII